jgi:hypothetical protein
MTHDTADLVDSLQGRVCPACGGMKKAKQTLCARDYYRLRPDQREALYRRVGEGYEEAFDDAMRTLGVTAPKLTAPRQAGVADAQH